MGELNPQGPASPRTLSRKQYPGRHALYGVEDDGKQAVGQDHSQQRESGMAQEAAVFMRGLGAEKQQGETAAIERRDGQQVKGEQYQIEGKGNAQEHREQMRDSFLRSEEHTSELQSLRHLVCRLLL